MNRIKKRDTVPLFRLKDHNGREFSISDHLGTPMVVFFYPKDDTPGCIREVCSFRDHYEDFITAGIKVIGISNDTPEIHYAFRKRNRLPFTLLSDEYNKVRNLFGVRTNLFGLIPGRVTYVIDQKGIIQHVFKSQFRVTRHVKEALKNSNKLKSLKT